MDSTCDDAAVAMAANPAATRAVLPQAFMGSHLSSMKPKQVPLLELRCSTLACGQAQEMERRKYDTEAERDTLVPVLRDVSRQEYLKKREEGKLEELRQALEDEEALFAVRARPSER